MYNVVFEYTQAAGPYRGVKTWTSFPSKEEADRMIPTFPAIQQGQEVVIAKGVSDDEAVAICRTTSPLARLTVALHESNRIIAAGLGGR
jgi:hypothetical protein